MISQFDNMKRKIRKDCKCDYFDGQIEGIYDIKANKVIQTHRNNCHCNTRNKNMKKEKSKTISIQVRSLEEQVILEKAIKILDDAGYTICHKGALILTSDTLELQEGVNKKGGVNKSPRTNPPPPPKKQGK